MPRKALFAPCFLPSIYLGGDQKARQLQATIRAIPRLNKKRYRSQNEFVKETLLERLRTDKTLILPKRRADLAGV